ncbi:class I SAM-dependent methyltransferase [Flavihumibacter fluvii]|uniref:class I SAM-dependent methyltransferase n=1 Tax=Flavihumibacter fluvii TaxID=2838157 RepID=UPI001BDF0F8E|nr:hypothetical protein [Flavihumibacter fluvii]ULQ50690.1 hypothetical protein KJS93_11420 [Flavihumibacter fluvii]
MDVPLSLQNIEIGDKIVTLFVPDSHAVQAAYNHQKKTDLKAPFPYWAKIWPSAKALAEYLVKRPGLYLGKSVMELAAGLGLPSLAIAPLAKKVICSDYQEQAVDAIAKSARQNRYNNLEPALMDWNDIPETATCDLLLLSDINYDPLAFEQLERLIICFIKKGSTILLATPQRLMAKPFIAAITGFISGQEDITVSDPDGQTTISILVLNDATTHIAAAPLQFR